MDNALIEQKMQEEKEVRHFLNKKFNANIEDRETELLLGQTKHRFDIYERGKFIGGITTSPWKNKTGSSNSGGQDRASTELLWLTLWRGDERRVMILTNKGMADRLYNRWKGCAFPNRIEIIHYNLDEKSFEIIGIL